MPDTLWKEAELCLGSVIEPAEWNRAKGCAERKLGLILERYGDADGARREPWYLAQLIAEAVRGERLSRILAQLFPVR